MVAAVPGRSFLDGESGVGFHVLWLRPFSCSRPGCYGSAPCCAVPCCAVRLFPSCSKKLLLCEGSA